MAENEDKGFVIKDRRIFSEENQSKENTGGDQEEPKVEEAAAAQEQAAPDEQAAPEPDDSDDQESPLPEVSFATFVFSLSSSALVHLGEIPEPATQGRRTDLPMAKQIIDTLGMLHEKTMGNLDPDEDRLMKSVLYDLRMRYVQKKNAK